MPLSSTVSTLRALGDNARHARRNHVRGVVAGLFAALSRDFTHPQLILAGLIYALTDSAVLVALVTIINKAAVLAPQLFVSSLLEHADRRKPHFIVLTVVRSIAFLSVALSVGLLGWRTNALTLTAFFLCYTVMCSTSGGGHIIFVDMIGRLIPEHRVGSFIGMRNFLGGLAAIAAGALVIQPILAGVTLPLNYFILALIGVGLAITDMSIWCTCREESGPHAEKKTTLGEAFRRGRYWLKRDHNYRCYFWQRVAFRVNYLGLAFFIPYGTEKLGYENTAGGVAVLGGIMVACIKLSRTVGSGLWGKAADRRGYRFALIGGGVFMTAAPLLALLAPSLPPLFDIGLPGVAHRLDLRLLVYLLALVCIGFGFQATILGGQKFLITNAPEERRASYVAFLNTITSPLTLLPLAGALMAEVAGMTGLFFVVTGGGMLALAGAVAMDGRNTGAAKMDDASAGSA